MQGFELLRHERFARVGAIHADRQNEQGFVCHVACAVYRVAPFSTEVTFQAALRCGRDYWDEIGAVREVAPNLTIVVVTHFEAVHVIPQGDAGRGRARRGRGGGGGGGARGAGGGRGGRH